MASADLPAGDDLERLLRWVDSGGHARVEPGAAGQVVVRLFTCDGGEEMDGFVSDDPAVAAWGRENAD